MTSEPDRIAPAGKLWVCHACGKTSRDRYGDPYSRWDASCALNSGLHDETTLVRNEYDRVIRIVEVPA
jgi:transposase-like protein